VNGTITDVSGIRVGHASDYEGLTGCTVVLMPPEGAVAGVSIRGAAPGTRETALLRSECLIDRIHAVMLAGGSAFGLDAAAGVMRALEEQGIGFPAGRSRVPIVPAAIIFDLSIGSSTARPTPEMAYSACRAASTEPVPEGCVGAGVGATVGKILGHEYAMKGGVGTASVVTEAGIAVGALAVVNAVGDVAIPSGSIIAGAVNPMTGGFADSFEVLKRGPASGNYLGLNTTLIVVATNASLDKTQANRLAEVCQNGLAQVIRPAHSQYDGDSLFFVSTGFRQADMDLLAALGVEVTARAIVRGVTQAWSLGGIKACSEVQ